MDMAKGVTDAFCTPWKICASTKTQTTRVSDTLSVNCVMCTDMANEVIGQWTWPITVLVSILRKFSVFLCYAANLNKRVCV